MAHKVSKARREEGIVYYMWCPGCQFYHVFGPTWSFNGDMERPTFSPSLLSNPSWPERRCHLLVRDGRIEFLSDCWHALAGQTVEMEDDDRLRADQTAPQEEPHA